MSDDGNDKWAEVLAGRSEPTDAATRQAARLRAYFEREAAEDLAQPVDPEAEKRMLNVLRARGAFDPDPPARARFRDGLADRLRGWFMLGGEARIGRFVAAGAMVVAVVVLAPVALQGLRGTDDEGFKGLHPADANAEQGVLAAQPPVAAAALVSALSQVGVVASSAPQGDDVVVRARIPADRLAAARQKLMDIGLAAPSRGELVVRFRKAS